MWTNPEKKFKELLNECSVGVLIPEVIEKEFNIKSDINPTIYFQYPIQRYLCDYVEPNKKIIFEINGDYYHANPLIYDDNKLTKTQKYNRYRDINKLSFLNNLGYTIFVIWES